MQSNTNQKPFFASKCDVSMYITYVSRIVIYIGVSDLQAKTKKLLICIGLSELFQPRKFNRNFSNMVTSSISMNALIFSMEFLTG